MTPEQEREMRAWMIGTGAAGQQPPPTPNMTNPYGTAPSGTPPSGTQNTTLASGAPAPGTAPTTVAQAQQAAYNRYQQAEGVAARKLDPNNTAEYMGPGYVRIIGEDGLPTVGLTDDPILLGRHDDWVRDRENGPRQTGPGGPAGIPDAAAEAFDAASGAPPVAPAANLYDAINRAQTGGTGAPQMDTSRVDTLLDGLSGVTNDILALGADNTGASVAEEQLKKAQALAAIQSAQATEQSQRSALGAARSSRARGDRAFAERQAIGEAAFIGQEAARTAAMQRAEYEGSLGEVRAAETNYDREFRLKALDTAADIGLNRSALEIDISKADLDAATEYLNQVFAQTSLDKQLSAQEAQSILQYTQAMAAIELEYAKLDSAERQHADELLMQRYGIDENTRVALEQIRAESEFQWDQVLSSFAGGIGSGLTGGIFNLLDGNGGNGNGGTSDRRAKKNVATVKDGEIEELLEAVKAESWDYKNPGKHGAGRFFGPMAQDLKKTNLGKAMVSVQDDGLLAVDTGRAGLAALSGLSLVWEKLKEIEEAVK